MQQNSKCRSCVARDALHDNQMPQTGTIRIHDLTQKSGVCDPQGSATEIQIWPYYQMIYAQTSVFPRKWKA